MKVPVSWLRELVDVPGPPAEIANAMSVRGFAVEGIDAEAGETVIDFEVTANRPDAMSMIGIAREVATAYSVPLKPAADIGRPASGSTGAAFQANPGGPDPRLTVVLEDTDLCPRYVGAVADVTVGPSPDWMQRRLAAAGIRPISNIVDITNYVLLELGQPMHAFDYAAIAGTEIRVRRARPAERLRTLDGQMRELAPHMLVIADAERPAAVAGVMGGGESEVSASTTRIVLESAYFNPLSVRRTSRTLGLKTEASMRFERGADPHLPKIAMERALQLIEETGAGRRRGAIVDQHRTPFGFEPVTLLLRRTRISGLLGAAIPDSDVERILTGLDFSAVRTNEGWRVSVPTRRVDVRREEDLVEEVARHYGLDRLPATFPPLVSAPRPPDPRIAHARRLRHLMTAMGFSEAVTFGFTSHAAAEPFVTDGALVSIKNPLSEAFAVLRPSLLPGLVESAGRNARRGRLDVRLFEAGNRFSIPRGESRSLAFVWTGSGRASHWSEKPRNVDFFDAKGVVAAIAAAHDADIRLQPLKEPPPFLVRGQAAAVLALRKQAAGSSATATLIGVVGALASDVAERLDLPSSVPAFVGELDLEALAAFEQPVTRVVPLPRYPSVSRDISIVVDEALPAQDVRATIVAAAPPTLVDVREFDRYQGKGIPDGKVSLSLRLTFRSSDRTLTDAEVQSAMEHVIAALAERHHAVQR